MKDSVIYNPIITQKITQVVDKKPSVKPVRFDVENMNDFTPEMVAAKTSIDTMVQGDKTPVILKTTQDSIPLPVYPAKLDYITEALPLIAGVAFVGYVAKMVQKR